MKLWNKTNELKKYIISSYILVWALIIFVAGSASLVFHAPPVIMWIVRNLIAWSPTYLLLIGWKHFRPDETRTAFVKRCFSGKMDLLLILCSFALTFGLSVLTLFIYSTVMGRPMLSYINFGITSLPLSIFLSFTSGPTGEELGWRGFMREDEANFIAYLACRESNDPQFVYSGAVLAFIHSGNALYADGGQEEYWEIYDSLCETARRDLSRDSAFWRQFDGKVAEVSSQMNDAYLKVNRQEDGVKSYGRMVDLLLAMYRQEGLWE